MRNRRRGGIISCAALDATNPGRYRRRVRSGWSHEHLQRRTQAVRRDGAGGAGHGGRLAGHLRGGRVERSPQSDELAGDAAGTHDGRAQVVEGGALGFAPLGGEGALWDVPEQGQRQGEGVVGDGAVLIVPYLLTVLFAALDAGRLRAWQHPTVPTWAWAWLGAPAYLVARSLALKPRVRGSLRPMWVGLVNAALATLTTVVRLGAVVALAAYFLSLLADSYEWADY